jgi:hypothetical protein
MKKICAGILMCLLLKSVFCQTDSTEYVVTQSTQFNSLSENECNRFIQKQTKRVAAQTLRLMKINNRYLHQFIKVEDTFLHSLCKFNAPITKPGLPENLVAQIDLTNNKLNDSAVIGNKSTGPKNAFDDQKLALHNPEIPSIPTFNSEARAEAMMMDAWYSFNRFENKCGREKNQGPQRYDAGVDTLNVSMQYLSENCAECDGTGKAEFLRASASLKREMKRTELIQNYISERREFLIQNMHAVPGAEAMLLPLRMNEVYFSRHIGECKKIFLDKSKWEKKLWSKITGASDFAALMDQHGALAQAHQSPQHSRPSLSLTKLIDEKVQSGIVTEEQSKILSSLLPQNIKDKTKKPQELFKTVDAAKVVADSAQVLLNDSTRTAEKPEKPWQPDPLKTKRFIDRCSVISNLQFDNRSIFLPASATAALGLQFMYHRNGSIGTALSCIQPMPRINPGSEDSFRIPIATGIGMRTFLDFKLKTAIYLQSGYEINWRPYENTSTTGRWERMPSAMAGLKIKYPVGKARTAPTIEFLYDFLHEQTGQPAFVFRTGVNIRSKHGIH